MTDEEEQKAFENYSRRASIPISESRASHMIVRARIYFRMGMKESARELAQEAYAVMRTLDSK